MSWTVIVTAGCAVANTILTLAVVRQHHRRSCKQCGSRRLGTFCGHCGAEANPKPDAKPGSFWWEPAAPRPIVDNTSYESRGQECLEAAAPDVTHLATRPYGRNEKPAGPRPMAPPPPPTPNFLQHASAEEVELWLTKRYRR